MRVVDDLLRFDRDFPAHVKGVCALLQAARKAGITLNLEKSEFYKEEIKFFGLRFTQQGISPTEDRVKAIHAAPPPEDAKALRSFLCSITWSSRFMPDICTIAEPL